MKKIYLSFFLIFSFAAFALNQQPTMANLPQTDSLAMNIPSIPSAPTTAKEKIVSQIKRITEDDREEDDDGYSQKRTPVIIPPPITPTTPVLNNIPPTTGKYKNGTYTGNAVAQYYGNVQVRAIISGGKLIDVVFVQYPNQGNSMEVNSYALPILRSEAISAQSAKIDAVSGASETSPAFIASLDSALKQALN